jgi:hypothetical protein
MSVEQVRELTAAAAEWCVGMAARRVLTRLARIYVTRFLRVGVAKGHSLEELVQVLEWVVADAKRAVNHARGAGR